MTIQDIMDDLAREEAGAEEYEEETQRIRWSAGTRLLAQLETCTSASSARNTLRDFCEKLTTDLRRRGAPYNQLSMINDDREYIIPGPEEVVKLVRRLGPINRVGDKVRWSAPHSVTNEYPIKTHSWWRW
jgi:hypothetical protein